MPLVTLDQVSVAFGHLPLLDSRFPPNRTRRTHRGCRTERHRQIHAAPGAGRERSPPDSGTVWRQPGLRVVAARAGRSALRQPAGVRRRRRGPWRFAAARHRLSPRGGGRVGWATPASLERLGRLQHELEERDGWRFEQRVELVLERLDLPADRARRYAVGRLAAPRAARARAGRRSRMCCCSTSRPTISTSTRSPGSRRSSPTTPARSSSSPTTARSSQRLATRIVELDRGRLTSWPGDYATFLRKKDEWLANEAVQQEKFDKKLADEEAWLRQGIKARRTRNEGRVRALMAMRARARRAAGRRAARRGCQVERAEIVRASWCSKPTDLSKRLRRSPVVRRSSRPA